MKELLMISIVLTAVVVFIYVFFALS